MASEDTERQGPEDGGNVEETQPCAEREQRSPSALWGAWWLLALAPVLYLLSSGPLLMCSERLNFPPMWLVNRIYTPVLWLCDGTPLAGPILWYLSLFGQGSSTIALPF